MATAALRSDNLPLVSVKDHAALLKVWVRRRRDSAHATYAELHAHSSFSFLDRDVNQLHALLCELEPGGLAEKI